MSQITTGIRSILSHPLIYKLLQSLVGMHKARQEYAEKYLRPTDGMRILDVGCGPADLLNYLPKNVQYYGVDLNPEYIEYAKKQFADRGVFICCDVKDEIIELQSQFDLVIATGLLHHLDDQSAISLLVNIAKRLAPGGRLVTLDPFCTGRGVLAKLIVKWDRGQHIRTIENYTRIASQAFSRVIMHPRDNMSRIPHGGAAIMECSL